MTVSRTLQFVYYEKIIEKISPLTQIPYTLGCPVYPTLEYFSVTFLLFWTILKYK